MDSDSDGEVTTDNTNSLRKMLKSTDDAVAVFYDTKGAVKVKHLTAKAVKLMRVATEETVDIWNYYWDSGEPLTKKELAEYHASVKNGGEEAQEWDEAMDEEEEVDEEEEIDTDL